MGRLSMVPGCRASDRPSGRPNAPGTLRIGPAKLPCVVAATDSEPGGGTRSRSVRTPQTKREGFSMSKTGKTNSKGKHVAVVVGATSKWQSDGRNTLLAHGKTLDDGGRPVGARWGVGGAIAQKFAQEGFFVVLTTRKEGNATALARAIG